MDIARLSMAYSASKVQTEAQILTLKKAMDVGKEGSANIIEMMSQKLPVGNDTIRGTKIDIRV